MHHCLRRGMWGRGGGKSILSDNVKGKGTVTLLGRKKVCSLKENVGRF